MLPPELEERLKRLLRRATIKVEPEWRILNPARLKYAVILAKSAIECTDTRGIENLGSERFEALVPKVSLCIKEKWPEKKAAFSWKEFLETPAGKEWLKYQKEVLGKEWTLEALERY